jgi:hypothetical protein
MGFISSILVRWVLPPPPGLTFPRRIRPVAGGTDHRRHNFHCARDFVTYFVFSFATPHSLERSLLTQRQSNPHDVFPVGLDQCNIVLAKALKERLGFRPRNKDRTQAAMNQKRLRSRVLIHRDHLVERYSPVAAVIGPEPDNRRKLTLGPRSRLRPVLLARSATSRRTHLS